MSYQAYQKASSRTENPRQTEYRLLGEVTRGMIAVKDYGPDRVGERASALVRNRQVWLSFAADCASKHNALPDQLRAGIISLSLYVSRETSEVIRGGGDIDALIDINKMIMQGLAPQGEQDSTAPAS